MRKPPTFVKAYTRDFSIIMEEAWYHALSCGMWKRIGQRIPVGYPNFYRLNHGIIEVWENTDFIQRILGAVGKKSKDTVFYDNLLIDYAVLVEMLKDTTVSDKAYLDTLFEAISIFAIIWYGILDEKTDRNIKDTLVAVRDRDTIFDTNDKNVRKRVARKYPEFRRFATTLLKKELLNTPPRVALLKKRQQEFIVIPGKYAGSISLDTFATKYHFSLAFFSHPKDRVIKGTVANRGKAIGSVRIIRKKRDVQDMQRGEILISPMTTPDVFPAMRKALAVVTDEGGMLCHAAIMSRELHIPCIIGTKVASEVYRNGDTVEVDAIKGIIKKLH